MGYMSPRKSEVWVTPIRGTAGDSQEYSRWDIFSCCEDGLWTFALEWTKQSLGRTRRIKDIFIYISAGKGSGMEVPKGDSVLHEQNLWGHFTPNGDKKGSKQKERQKKMKEIKMRTEAPSEMFATRNDNILISKAVIRFLLRFLSLSHPTKLFRPVY